MAHLNSQGGIETLWQSEQAFRTVVESALNGIVVVNREGVIVFVNTNAADMLGYTKEQMNGMKVETLVPERVRQRHVKFRAGFLEDLKVRPMGAGRDLFARRKDGSEVPVEIGLNPIEVEQDIAVLCSIIDITERKRAEEEIVRYTQKLEYANSELSEYAHAVSHDLKAPLRAIRNYGNFLHKDLSGILTGHQKEYLDGLGKAVDEADRLVAGLLELSKIDLTHVFYEEVDMGALMSKIKESFDLSDTEEILISAEWPFVNTSHLIVPQIFQNLISNGLKFNESPHKVVQVGWNSGNKDVYEFFVRDNGIGIKPEYHERIFGVFEKLHADDRYEGTGIGLAIANKAARLLEGSIRLESQLGQGSTFYVTLPRTRSTS